MNELNTSVTFENYLHNIFSNIESMYNLPTGSFDITDSKAQIQDNSMLRFVSIVEPPYPKSLSSSSRRLTVFKYSIKDQIKLFVPRNVLAKLSDTLTATPTIKDLQSDVAFLHFYYTIDDSSIYDLIKFILCDCIDNYTPSSSFGCCSKYQECSTLGKCIHENNLYAKGCYYRKNLESGRCFLKMPTASSSKNKRSQKGNSLQDFASNFVAIDIETTGLDPAHDHIIEIAAVKVQNDEVIDSFSSLINPHTEISDFISQLTGITNQNLSTAPEIKSVLESFYNFIGTDILLGHNIHFDINFLYDNFEKYLSVPLRNDFVDTLRMSRKLIKNLDSHKLSSLVNYFNLNVSTAHRALADCQTTIQLYSKLKDLSPVPYESQTELLNSLNFDASNPFYGKRIVVKGVPQLYSFDFMKQVADMCNAKMGDVFYTSCDYIVFSHYTYKSFLNGSNSEKFSKAKELVKKGSLTILSEEEWCKMLNIPIPVSSSKNKSHSYVSAKDIVTTKDDFDETHPLYGKTCVFTGTLEKMSRKDAMQIVVDYGGLVGNSVTKKTNYLILGNNDYCSSIKDGKSSKQKKAEALKLSGNDIEIISESVFYDMICE